MPTEMEVSFTDRFWPSVYELAPAEIKQVVKAVTQLSRDPMNDSLRLKPVGSARAQKKYTCRASQDVRILLMKQGELLMLDRAGHHDAMYELAGRVDLVFNQGTGRVVVVQRGDGNESGDRPGDRVVPKSALADIPGVFDHWANADLADAGFDENQITAIRRCTVEDDLVELPFDVETVSLLIDLLGQTPEQWRNPGLDAEAAATERLRVAIDQNGPAVGISPLFSAEEIDKLADGPIEEWMVFLHPDQRDAVGRHYEGPARVRGSAGTGKTVVGLHRAAALVRRFEAEPDTKPVLFTTFIKSLPPVFERLYHRLPNSRPSDRIEFAHIDRVAYRVCADAGDRPVFDPRKVDSAFGRACRDVLIAGSPLMAAGVTREYVRVEIASVIKGRGITSVDEYLALERTGRRMRFGEAMRRQVWALKEAFDHDLADAGVVDFPDVILRARDHARARSEPAYRAAIIDEAQDLTLVGLQLVRSLVNGAGRDRPDGLLVVGDGAQRIYPGGFTLRQAGVEVRGRTTVLRTNYRNTSEIIAAAMAVAGTETVDDLGDVYARGDADATALRDGVRPVLVRCKSVDDQANWVAGRLRELCEDGGLGYGDIAVAAATNKQVDELRRLLAALEIPMIDLKDYNGTPVDKVKIGTHFRIKGLEFKVVFLACVGADEFPRRPYPGEAVEETAEQRALAVSQLFVAMTRARDRLILLAAGEPSPVLVPALDRFDVVDC